MTAFAVGGRVFGISHLPGRVHPALYEEVDGRVDPLAYFNSEAAANRAVRLIDALRRAPGDQTLRSPLGPAKTGADPEAT